MDFVLNMMDIMLQVVDFMQKMLDFMKCCRPPQLDYQEISETLPVFSGIL